MIELLLAKDADVNAADKNKEARTPLDHAVENGFKTTAEVLIGHKANVNARLPDGSTPLHEAASRGFSAVAELLLAHGADVNAADKNGNTPLFIAVRDGRPEVVQLLLASKADVNFTNSTGETPLFAAKNDNQSEVAKLLLAGKADVNHRNKDGDTPLQIAVRNKETELVKLLLANKANVNAATEIGVTPLLFAAANSDVDINLVKALLEAGADTQAHIKEGGRNWGNIIVPGVHALDLAIGRGRADEVELLLASHADPNARFDSATPLHSAVVSVGEPKSAEELDLLLNHGADPDLADQEGGRRCPAPSAKMTCNWCSCCSITMPIPTSRTIRDCRRWPIFRPRRKGGQGQSGRRRAFICRSRGRRGQCYTGPAYPGQSTQANNSAQIKAALLKAGANEDFQRVARIFIAQKGSGSIGKEVFYKGTNSVNHYSLFELVAEAYQDQSHGAVPYPDFAHVVINRLHANGMKEEINVNLDEIFASGDCSKDVPLEWGDVVQIPQMDHLVNSSWQGYQPGDNIPSLLKKCLQRQVEIIVKGQTNTFTLVPHISQFSYYGQLQRSSTAEKNTLYTFSLKDMVHQANVLLLSSDLTRVKVTRGGLDMQYNLEASASPDLRLRDGDIIEIPERDANAPAAK